MDFHQLPKPPRTRIDAPIGVHLNLNVRGLSPSATLAINEKSVHLHSNGRQIFKMGLGQSPFPVPEIVVEALRLNAHQKDYLPVKGLMELRNAVADYHRRQIGNDYSGQNVLIGPGSKELMFLLQLTYYGDLVIPMPSWVSYAPQAHIVGRNVYWLTTHSEHEWHLTPDELENLCRSDPSCPRLVILNYPSNPTGLTYQIEELEAMAEVARRYQVLLLSDEIYGPLHHEGSHVSIASFYPEGTIVSSGLSKWCGAGGWRLGTFLFPPALGWLLDAMAVVASETYTSTSAPIQHAAVRAFQGGSEIDDYLNAVRRLLGALGNHLARMLDEAGAHIIPPDGAFYLFPDFSPFQEKLRARGIKTSEELCSRLLEDTGVAILPGYHFGLPPDRLCARLAYVNFDGASALHAVTEHPHDKPLDQDFLQAHCPEPLHAVNRICEWLHI